MEFYEIVGIIQIVVSLVVSLIGIHHLKKFVRII